MKLGTIPYNRAPESLIFHSYYIAFWPLQKDKNYPWRGMSSEIIPIPAPYHWSTKWSFWSWFAILAWFPPPLSTFQMFFVSQLDGFLCHQLVVVLGICYFGFSVLCRWTIPMTLSVSKQKPHKNGPDLVSGILRWVKVIHQCHPFPIWIPLHTRLPPHYIH